MMFQVHDLNSAPAGSREALAKLVESYGFLPNIAGVFAESPPVLSGLLGAISAFNAKEMTLSPVERQVVLLAASARNRCEYCVAAHGMLASLNGLSRDEVENLQQGRALREGRMEALRRFVEVVIDSRGWVSEGELEKFLRAGFTKAQVLEVIFGVALKTLTNYANHITKPSVNEQFAEFLPNWNNTELTMQASDSE